MAKKGAVVAKNLADSRYTDIKDEPVTRLLAPISGYEKCDLVSLEEAIAPIAHLFEDIDGNAWVAKENSLEPEDGLTQDMSAAIHLYTMQFSTEPSLFQELNKTLRTENRQALKPWFPYLRLFLTALYTLPSRAQTVYRGVRGVDLRSKYQSGTKFAWWSVSSCTESIDLLKSDQFLGNKGLRTLFLIECQNGKFIRPHSYFKETETEIVLMPGSYFQVMGQLDQGNDLHIIQLKEIQPPCPLVKPPRPWVEPPFVKSQSSTVVKPVPPTPTPTTAASKPKIVEHKEFAEPGIFKPLGCEGRACAKCHKCRDWLFTGDRKTWNWLANYENWKDEDWKRYRDNRVWERFTKRDGATCYYYGYYYYYHHCFCEDHFRGN